MSCRFNECTINACLIVEVAQPPVTERIKTRCVSIHLLLLFIDYLRQNHVSYLGLCVCLDIPQRYRSSLPANTSVFYTQMIGHIKRESVNLLWFSVLASRLWMGSDHTDADGGSVWTPVAVVMCDSRQDCACNRGWSGSVLHLLRRKPAAQLWMRILTRLTGIVAHQDNSYLGLSACCSSMRQDWGWRSSVGFGWKTQSYLMAAKN